MSTPIAFDGFRVLKIKNLQEVAESCAALASMQMGATYGYYDEEYINKKKEIVEKVLDEHGSFKINMKISLSKNDGTYNVDDGSVKVFWSVKKQCSIAAEYLNYIILYKPVMTLDDYARICFGAHGAVPEVCTPKGQRVFSDNMRPGWSGFGNNKAIGISSVDGWEVELKDKLEREPLGKHNFQFTGRRARVTA